MAYASGGAELSQPRSEIRYGYALLDRSGAVNGEPLPCPERSFGEGSSAGAEPPRVEAVGMSFFLDPALAGRARVARSDGSVNDAGSPATGVDLAAPIVGVTTMPRGLGYWLVGADGGVFTAPGADFHGSTGDRKLDAPVVGIAATASGSGYWLAAADGGVFAFGKAIMNMSLAGQPWRLPTAAIALWPQRCSA